MHNIMIVDDENIIREGLINAIDWPKYGYHVVAEAENGKKALEIAKKVKPHIILTDIYMPIMDGIEFAAKIKQELPEAVIIFLSGYNEFTYAQKAIEIGIYRFLTKPIEQEELLVVLEEAAKDLEHKELEQTQIDKLKLLIHDSLPLLKERFFLSLVRGTLDQKEISRKLQYLNIDLRTDRFFCMIFSLDDYFKLIEKQNEADIHLLKFAIQNMGEELLADLGQPFFCFEDRRNEIGLLFCFHSSEASDYLLKIYRVLQKIQEAVRRYLETTISIGIGSTFDSLVKISESYREAEDALAYKTAFGKNSIIYIGDIQSSEKHTMSRVTFEKIRVLMKAVKGGNDSLASTAIEEIFDIFEQETNLKKDYIHLFAIEIFGKFTAIILELNGDFTEIYGHKLTPLVLLNFDTLEDIRLKLQELANRTIAFIHTKRKTVNRNFIEKAKEFINQHYGIEGLNLSTIADSVHVSPGYLSQLFKQVVGESCIEYLSKVRISQAKKLLKETNLKAYEIAYRVGYSDSQYFSTCFKKYVGVSPTDYRNMIANDIFEED
ncbi:MAG: response regulator transcription factor [Firmicutes bacterium]|nr:response regulator transcription factor [Bacillota bacterium]